MFGASTRSIYDPRAIGIEVLSDPEHLGCILEALHLIMSSNTRYYTLLDITLINQFSAMIDGSRKLC